MAHTVTMVDMEVRGDQLQTSDQTEHGIVVAIVPDFGGAMKTKLLDDSTHTYLHDRKYAIRRPVLLED